MLGRHSVRQEDPFRRINAWDDGYEPTPTASREPPIFHSPTTKSRAARSYEPDRFRRPEGRDADPYPRRPPHSEGAGPRRRRRSPAPRGPVRSPSPSRRRDLDRDEDEYPRHRSGRRPSLEPHPSALLPSRAKGVRDDVPPVSSYGRSPSPPRHRRDVRDRERDLPDHHHRPERHRSPSPPGHRPRDHEYERDRAEDHDRHPTSRREHSPRSSGSDRRHKHHHSSHRRSPSPSHRRDKPAPAAAAAAPTTHRPTISRSKTTSAKERFANLSPKWQKAAAAAFQAGSLAALNMRSEPGPWKGEKGARIATAALGAAALDAFAKEEKEVEKKNSSSGGGSKSKSGGGLSSNKKSTGAGPDVEALGGVLGGFLIDQIAARRQSGKGRDKHHH